MSSGAERVGAGRPRQRGVRLRPVGPEDKAGIDRLLDRLTGYSIRVDGIPKAAGGAQRLLTALPPGRAMDAKHVFMVMQGSELAGLVDVIDGYPDPGVAFIGLLAIAENKHDLGLGRAALCLTEDFARSVLHASRLRLAVVDATRAGLLAEDGVLGNRRGAPLRGRGRKRQCHPHGEDHRDGGKPSSPSASMTALPADFR